MRQQFSKVQKAYNTRNSQDVSDPSTNRAQRCLTCQIGRDGVFSTWYGRKHAYNQIPSFYINVFKNFIPFYEFQNARHKKFFNFPKIAFLKNKIFSFLCL